jgi:L-alanine-DL-glutamate epimerase-like enolase superfamily enzyme
VAAAGREPGDYVIADIEQTLWDIGGKLPGVPVRMLGGAARDTLSNDMDIAVDLHGRVHKAMARVL